MMLNSMSSRASFVRLGAAGPVVLPSLLLCDFAELGREIRRLEEAGAEALHLDVMDGQFVPNFTYGLTIVAATRRVTSLPLDVHLMIATPERIVDQFAEAGGDHLTVHIEATKSPRELLQQIRRRGASTGLALNPGTPLAAIEGCLDLCDSVLVMSVEPGFGGQAFEPAALDKLKALRKAKGPDFRLGVDGGVNEHTIAACAAAGANWFVVGSGIFKQPNYGDSIAQLTRLASIGL
jgi:ribulose-phosphate 3-epimerase